MAVIISRHSGQQELDSMLQEIVEMVARQNMGKLPVFMLKLCTIFGNYSAFQQLLERVESGKCEVDFDQKKVPQ